MKAHARTRRAWPLPLLSIVPLGFVLVWGLLIFGGWVEDLEAEETRGLKLALEELAAALPGELAAAVAETPWIIRLSPEGRPLEPFAPLDPERLLESLPASLGVRAGMELESRGRNAEALRFFRHARTADPTPFSAPALLSMARALEGVGRRAEALAVLTEMDADQEVRPETWPLTPSLLARLLACRIRGEGTEDLGEAILDFRVKIPAGVAPLVLSRLHLSEETARRRANHLRLARIFLEIEAGRRSPPSSPVLLEHGGALFSPRPEEIRMLTPEALTAAVDAARRATEARHPGVRLQPHGGLERAGATRTLPPFAWKAQAAFADPPRSRRLARYADLLLVAAGVAFLAGNLLLLRVARREAALSRLRADFVDSVSHQLRTPLAALHLKTEMLSTRPLPHPISEKYLRSLHGDVLRLESLVDTMLRFDRERGGERS